MALSNDQATFVEGVSRQTGIDPRVLVAWLELENADARGGTGHFNYLNLRPYQGDPFAAVSPGGFEQFSSVTDAITATVRRLRQPFAAPIEQAAQARSTPQQEITAIAATGWDAGHYGGPGGPNLQHEFASIFTQAGLTSSYQGPGTAAAVASTAQTGSAADITSSTGGIAGAASSVAGAVTAPFTAAERAFKFLTSWRFVEVVGGFLLLLVGLYLLGRQFGLSVPAPPGAAAAKGAASELSLAKVETQRERTKEVRSRRRRNLELSRETRAQREARETRAYYRGAADAS